MKKLKIPVKKKRAPTDDLSRFNFEIHFKPRKPVRILFYVLAIILPILFSVYYIISAQKANQFLSFPLDDPWIHLTFAKNLAQYFSFSYFKNEMVTAGSTSPLYTFILSLLFLTKGNEMYISYFLGISFFAAGSFAFYKLSILEFDNEIIFALICSGMFIVDKWLNFIADSGMETTMFIFLLILCFYFYKKRSAVAFAVLLGLVIWTRPDGVALIAAVIIDYILVLIYSRNDVNCILFSSSELKKIAIIFGAIIGLYFLMNYLLSGSLLPNTFKAKLIYYSPEFRSREDFIRDEVWEYFTSGAYFVLKFGFIFSILKLGYDIYKGNYNQNTVYVVFILALIFIYWLKLPYAHRFGRYLMPLIPFYILVSTIGFRDLARFVNKYTANDLFSKSIFYIWAGVIFFMSIKQYGDTNLYYAEQCKYIYERQVMAAKWIKANTTENDIIATHDVGAIGFYSGRKIVDVAGLVTPELINKINDANYVDYMTKYLRDKKVTYLAFLREWYRVSNQEPVFTTVKTLPPEVMEVYKFNPETHILSREVNSLLMNAATLVSQKAGQQILQLTNRVLQTEPKCSQAYYLRAFGNYFMKNDGKFEEDMLKAMELFPENNDARLYLGIIYNEQKRYEEAKVMFEKALTIEPTNSTAIQYLKNVNLNLAAKQDSVRKK